MAAQHLPRDLVRPIGLKELAQTNNDKEMTFCIVQSRFCCFVDLQGELRSHQGELRSQMGKQGSLQKAWIERCQSRPELNGARRYKRSELRCTSVFSSAISQTFTKV